MPRRKKRSSRRKPDTIGNTLRRLLGLPPKRPGNRRKPKTPVLPVAALVVASLIAIPQAIAWINNQMASPCDTGRYEMVISGISDLTNDLPTYVEKSATDVWLNQIPSMMKSGTIVRLATLTGRAEAPLSFGYQGCSTKRGNQALIAFETSRQLDANWAELFGAGWEEAVNNIPTGEAHYTPLLEGISKAYRDADRMSDQVERIIIPVISDAMIHLIEYSSYRTSGNRSLFDPEVQARLIANAPDLSKADIILYLVPPEHTDSQGRGLTSRQEQTVQFLYRYFNAAGADFTVRTL